MAIEVTVPNLPESVADATVIAWHKKAGEPVARDENLADLETDKVVLEVPSPIEGVLGEILKESGATVTAGDVLAVLEPLAEGRPPRPGIPPRRAPRSRPAAGHRPSAPRSVAWSWSTRWTWRP